MTRAIFFRHGDALKGVRVSGHAGYADTGNDIVCSAISTACHMAALGLTEVLGLKARIKAKGADILIVITEADLAGAQPMLRTLERELQEISKQYPDHIRIGYQERRELTCFN